MVETKEHFAELNFYTPPPAWTMGPVPPSNLPTHLPVNNLMNGRVAMVKNAIDLIPSYILYSEFHLIRQRPGGGGAHLQKFNQLLLLAAGGGATACTVSLSNLPKVCFN